MDQNAKMMESSFNFILNIRKPITIYGSGKQTRSFCYIDDLIKAFYKFMKLKNFHGPINIGNPNEINVLTLASKIIKLTKSKSKLVYKSIPLDDPFVRKPDISVANQILKWSPKINIEQGLLKTIKYFNSTKF